jgi:hypothetical protein
MIAAGFVHQNEVRERVQRLQQQFATDNDVARIDYRLGEDWSGDESVFFDVVLNTSTPSAATVMRLSEQLATALLNVVRSEELGLHSYLNFVSPPGNGQ